MRLTVSGLSFSYASETVLDGVGFTAEAGECVAILGTNGAGKSTMLKCADRILNYKAGRIEADGVDVRSMRPSERARRIAYVPQSPHFADSTVFDAVLNGRLPYIRFDATDADLRVTENVIDRLGLTRLALRPVSELSGGEAQKVAVARALAQQPDILLLDEPTSNLDIRSQTEVAALIRGLARDEGIAVVVTMHDLNLALRLADRFVLLRDSSVCAAGGREIITRENIKNVYGLDVYVEEIHGRTVVIPE